MPTKATINQTKYDKAHCRTYGLKMNLETDKDIIAKLSSVPNMQGYIKQLIRQDINGSVPVPVCTAALEELHEQADKAGTDVSK